MACRLAKIGDSIFAVETRNFILLGVLPDGSVILAMDACPPPPPEPERG